MLRSCEAKSLSTLDVRILKAVLRRRQIRASMGLVTGEGTSFARLALVPNRRCFWDGVLLFTWDCDCTHCFNYDGDDEEGDCRSLRPFSKTVHWPPTKRSLLTYTEKPCTLAEIRSLYSDEDRAQFKEPDQRSAKQRAKDKAKRQQQRKKDGKKKAERE